MESHRQTARFHLTVEAEVLGLCIIGILLFVLFINGCSPGRQFSTGDPMSAPSKLDPAIVSIIPTVTMQVENPSPEPGPEIVPSLTSKTKHFQSPLRYFELDYPADWLVFQEDASVTFRSRSNTALLRVSWIDTGYALDVNSFFRLVDGRESNLFQVYRQYYEISQQKEANFVIVMKRFLVNGEKKAVLSYYSKSGQAVLILDFWSDPNNLVESQVIADRILRTLKTHQEAFVKQKNVVNNATIIYETDYFVFQVPIHWKHTRTSARSSIVDTFHSPDEMAIFQTIIYSDRKPLSTLEIGPFVLSLLNRFYTRDITITKDITKKDQWEDLTWHSMGSKMQGVTSFQVRENTLILFTIINKVDYEDLYQPVLERILDSYQTIHAIDPP